MSNLDLITFQTKLGYSFRNVELLQQALTHRSFSKTHNERLEFLGDSLVNTVIAELIFLEYRNVSEGHLSAMRSSLVRRETLAEVAKSISLGDFLLLGGGTLKTGGHRLESILADTYEAVVAAVYLDSDWAACSQMIKEHFEGRIQGLENMADVRDAKSKLQEWLQARSLSLPEYQTIDVEGPGHAQRFKIRCVVENQQGEFLGEGSNRRAAEQLAAEMALKSIESLEANEKVIDHE